jgi:hypothetical protein
VHLLENGDDGRVDLLQVEDHHEYVGVAGQTATARVPNIADLLAKGQPCLTVVVIGTKRKEKKSLLL